MLNDTEITAVETAVGVSFTGPHADPTETQLMMTSTVAERGTAAIIWSNAIIVRRPYEEDTLINAVLTWARGVVTALVGADLNLDVESFRLSTGEPQSAGERDARLTFTVESLQTF